MAEKYVSSLNGYIVKDAQAARELEDVKSDVQSCKTGLSAQASDITALQNAVSAFKFWD